MSDTPAKLYEGMFLINPQVAAGDLSAAIDHVQEILNRANAEAIVLHQWDERRLAFPIKGQKRGLYIYTLFNVQGSQLAGIERDCNLSEMVMRVLMLRADHMGETEIELAREEAKIKGTQALLAQQQAEETPDAPETQEEEPVSPDAASDTVGDEFETPDDVVAAEEEKTAD